MPFCPSCRYEFDPHIASCSECGAELVAELPEEEAPTEDHGIPLDVIVYCPSCVHIFPPAASSCPECGVRLTATTDRGALERTLAEMIAGGLRGMAELSGEDTDDEEDGTEWETVHEAPSLADAAFIESVLEEREIPTRILDGAPRASADGRMGIGADVQAPKDKAEEAREAVKEAIGSDDEDETEGWDEWAELEKQKANDDRAYVDRMARAAAGRLRYGDPEGGLVLVREALQKRPEEIELIALEAACLSESGDKEGARASVEKGLAISPGYGALLERKLWASLRGGDGTVFGEGCDLDAAADAGDRFLAQKGRDVRLHELLAEVARRRGRGEDEIRKRLEAALAVNPEFVPAKRLLSELGGGGGGA